MIPIRLMLIAAFGLALAGCSGVGDRGGDNSLHPTPDAAANEGGPAVSPTPEPPLGSATHP
jgi:hypothetical protein